jgi:hypothetical protein
MKTSIFRNLSQRNRRLIKHRGNARRHFEGGILVTGALSHVPQGFRYEEDATKTHPGSRPNAFL